MQLDGVADVDGVEGAALELIAAALGTVLVAQVLQVAFPGLVAVGQSSGWLISKNSVTPLRASNSSGLVVFCTTMPSMTFVRQLATGLGMGRGSFVLPWLTFTMQVRQ